MSTRSSITSRGMHSFGLLRFFCVSRDSPEWSILSKTSQSMYTYAFSINPGFLKRAGTHEISKFSKSFPVSSTVGKK